MKNAEVSLLDFLTEDQAVTTGERIKNVFIAFVLMIGCVNITVVALTNLWSGSYAISSTDELLLGVSKWDGFTGFIAAPLWEELMFRVFPFGVATYFARTLGDKSILIYVFIASAIIFGWLHGQGVVSLMIQGVGGLILAWVYIKNGLNYWSSVAVHAMYNGFLIFLA